MTNVKLKNATRALLTADAGKGRGLHFLAGEVKEVSAATLEAPDIRRLIKKGCLAVLEDRAGETQAKKKNGKEGTN